MLHCNCTDLKKEEIGMTKATKRTERVGLALTPETFKGLKMMAAMKNDTMNNFVHTLIDAELSKEEDNLKKYVEFIESI